MLNFFNGTATAMITPFSEDGSVNFAAFGRMIDYQIENGTDMLVILGTTGEPATMTEEEMQELLDQCTWTWTKRNDVKGYNIEGPSGESIFLPVTGYREGPDSGIDVDNAGYYWTGTLRSDDTNYPYVLTFGEGFKGLNVNKDILRSYGCAIRPVQDK